MWLQTPLVCCTVDHMFTLKRISGVSPSGAEINVNSWVQIFLSPRCWKAHSQSRGLGHLLWAAQLNWALRDPGSVWHRAAHASGQRTDSTTHTHIHTYSHQWKPDGWCLQPLCVTHVQKWLCYSLELWSVTSQSHSQCLLLFFSLIKPLKRLGEDGVFFLWKKNLKIYLHSKLYTHALERGKILLLPTVCL